MALLPKVQRWLKRWRGEDRAIRAIDPAQGRTRADRAGLWGEGVAAATLEAEGYRILGRRVRVGRDELDLVATPGRGGPRQLVFVEVKTRAFDAFGGGRAAVDKRKRRALCRAAARYLRRMPMTPFRFDLIEVIGEEESAVPPVVRHFENVFPMELRYLHPALHRMERPGK
ncbi:MAG: YraN family protein [Kiritimatiellia bacterium]|jgi:putative endonuclease